MNKKLIIKNDLDIISKYRTQLMGIAALMVIILHAWTPINDNLSYIGYLEGLFREFGNYGVDIFFFLSGLGCFYSIKKNSTKEFYKHRFKRIIIPFLLVSIINMFINNSSFISFIKSITLYNFYFVNVYYSCWFIQAIVSLYIIFPWYYKLFNRVKNKTLFTIIIIAIMLILLWLFQKQIRNDFYIFIVRIPDFLIGIWLGWFITNSNFKLTYNKQIIIHLSFIIAIVMEYLRIHKNIYIINECIPKMLIAFSLSVVLANLLNKNSNRKTLIKILTFLGTISLELYLTQELSLYMIIIRRIAKYLPVLIFNFVIISIAIFIAYVIYILDKYSWIIIEKKKV